MTTGRINQGAVLDGWRGTRAPGLGRKQRSPRRCPRRRAPVRVSAPLPPSGPAALSLRRTSARALYQSSSPRHLNQEREREATTTRTGEARTKRTAKA